MIKIITVLFFFLFPCVCFGAYYDYLYPVCPSGSDIKEGWVSYSVGGTSNSSYTVRTNGGVYDGLSDSSTKYIRARCDSSTIKLAMSASLETLTLNGGTFIADSVVTSGGTSVEVISFAVGALMGLAFAVSSVYKW